MGKKTVRNSGEQSVRFRDAGPEEQAIRRELLRIVQATSGQLGDLSGLASGEALLPTAEDERLVNDVTRRTGQVGRRDLESSLLARGIEGSSIEAVDRAVLEGELSAQRSSMLLQLPQQRAQMQIAANQELFNRLLGAANPALQANLAERLGSGTTTTKGNQTTSGITQGEFLGAVAAGVGGAMP